jgi:hypothetical protein
MGGWQAPNIAEAENGIEHGWREWNQSPCDVPFDGGGPHRRISAANRRRERKSFVDGGSATDRLLREPLLVNLNGPLPSLEKAADELRAGIEGRDEERAAHAVVALSRSAAAACTGEVLSRFAGRDRTFIGHHAILMPHP